MDTRHFIPLKICDRYNLKRLIAQGTKTRICAAVDDAGRRYAAKLTDANEADFLSGTFEAEVEVFTALVGGQLPLGRRTIGRTPNGFPNIYFVGTHREKYDVIIMDSPAIDLFNFNYFKSLSIRDHQNLACDMLDCLMVLHQHGFVHRDVKPQNFMLDRRGKVQLIDFSLSTRYRDPNTNVHHPMRRQKFFYGTLMYGSINALRLTCQSRRDDLVSLAYSLIEIIKGYLPWDERTVSPYGETAIQQMIRIKESNTPFTLCAGLPKGFFDYMAHVTTMAYAQTPDYNALREMLKRK